MIVRYSLKIRSSVFFILLFLASNLFSTLSLCASLGTEPERDLLFHTNDPIEITLLSNFKKLFDDRGDDRSNHRGVMYYLANDQDTIFCKVKLKTRGNFRRDPANCKYPPIRVKFGSEVDEDSLFANQSKLKVVIQCQIEKYVLLEYLAYRIYNLITEQSYKVRLAHITYADKETGKKHDTKYGFFIESRDKLEERLGAEFYHRNMVQYFVDRRKIITMALFQYMIGNDDWYVTSKHNMTTLRELDSEDLLAVPYDFDWSTLVDAKYTKPPGVHDSKLRERRVYRGLCMTSEELVEQQTIFNDKKEQIINLINEVPNLSAKDRNWAKTYIEQFYTILNAPKSYNQVFTKEKCIVEQEIGGAKKSPTN